MGGAFGPSSPPQKSGTVCIYKKDFRSLAVSRGEVGAPQVSAETGAMTDAFDSLF